MTLQRSTGFVSGLRYGYRLAHRSLLRRFAAQALWAAVLTGWSIGLIWATASNIHLEWRTFLRTQSLDPEPAIAIITKPVARVKLMNIERREERR